MSCGFDRRTAFAREGSVKRAEKKQRAILMENAITTLGYDLCGRRMVVLRHGERADEVDARSWAKEAHLEAAGSAKRRVDHVFADPPLTSRGFEQAQRAAETIAQLLDSEGVAIDRIYCSRLRRTVQTAGVVARHLNKHHRSGERSDAMPVIVSSGLAASSAVVQKLLTSFQFISFDVLQEVAGHDVQLLDGDSFLPPALHWRPPLEEVAQREHVSLVIAHRESIRFLTESSFSTPYCCIADFHFTSNGPTLNQLYSAEGEILPFSTKKRVTSETSSETIPETIPQTIPETRSPEK